MIIHLFLYLPSKNVTKKVLIMKHIFHTKKRNHNKQCGGGRGGLVDKYSYLNEGKGARFRKEVACLKAASKTLEEMFSK